jgi:hypothetical protein
LLSKLSGASSLSSVKKWFHSEPAPVRYPASPFGWVEWAGGPKNPETQTGKVVDDFHVVLVKKSADSDGNEDALIALCAAAEAAIEADHTLNGTTFDCYVSNREVQKIPQKDYEIAAVRLTVHTWRLL